MVANRCQLVVDLKRLHLGTHEGRDFIIKALEFGLKSSLGENMDDGPVCFYELVLCSTWDPDSCNVIAVVIIQDEDISVIAG